MKYNHNFNSNIKCVINIVKSIYKEITASQCITLLITHCRDTIIHLI